MATSAIIKIEGLNFAQVYKHYDGFPENILPWLEEFNTEFQRNRGSDPEYKLAQLLRSSKRLEDKFDLDPNNFTGWGIVSSKEEWGAQFIYTLHKDGSVSYRQSV
jgi:hypothetical protein